MCSLCDRHARKRADPVTPNHGNDNRNSLLTTVCVTLARPHLSRDSDRQLQASLALFLCPFRQHVHRGLAASPSHSTAPAWHLDHARVIATGRGPMGREDAAQKCLCLV